MNRSNVTLKNARSICLEVSELILGRIFDPNSKTVAMGMILKRMKIVFNPRLRTTGGRARLKTSSLQLNKKLLLENPEEFRQVVIHEFCHLVDREFYGRSSGHGRRWQVLMRLSGAKVTRTHSMACEIKRHKVRATAHCKCGSHEIKTRMFNKMLNGSTYRCGSCRGRIILDTETLVKNMYKIGGF